MEDASRYIRRLAELSVRFGANVQPGQIVALSSEPGKEPLARAVAEVAYEQGAKFVDLRVSDPYVRHARMIHTDPEGLDYAPPWVGERLLALGEHRAARIALSGRVAPHLMDDVDPALLGKERPAGAREALRVLNDCTTNWTIVPCPTQDWARLVHPDLDSSQALAQLWREIAQVCRLDQPDPVTAWRSRFDRLAEVAEALSELHLDAVHFEGAGTDLRIGLLPSSTWMSGAMRTIEGIVHAPNIPTEEIFTTPDPLRVEGVVRSTKPLFAVGRLITGLEVRFEAGRAVGIDAESGAEALRSLVTRDEGAARLGEVALVDGASRVGASGTVFFDTLLDENAASHIALGAGLGLALADPADHKRMNESEIHVDFMIGSNQLAVSAVTRDGREIPLLRGGEWQL